MIPQKLDAANLDRLYPVGQNAATGRWGWRRLDGQLRHALCTHATESEARADRGRANESFDLGSR